MNIRWPLKLWPVTSDRTPNGRRRLSFSLCSAADHRAGRVRPGEALNLTAGGFAANESVYF
jgi:hypothetical protein